MISKWFNEDIQAILSKHRYVVVTDVRGEGEYLLKYLPVDIRQIYVKDEWGEIEAKYLAESEYANDKVVFYVKKKAENLTYLQEYIQTAGVLILDDMDTYIRRKIFDATGKNTAISKDKLLLAARLSESKDVKWWQSIAEGTLEPLKVEDYLTSFLDSPNKTKEEMDETVWQVFRQEVYQAIGLTATDQPAETMSQEVVNKMLTSFIDNTINGLLLETYYHWTDSREKSDSLRRYVDSFTLSTDINPLLTHPDHPFAELDRRLMKMLSDAIKFGKDQNSILNYITNRTKSSKAKSFKAPWLSSVLTCSTYKVEGLAKIGTYQQVADYYRTQFCKLDTAMRKIYVAWLNDEPTLRPLQEHYTLQSQELLNKWYSIDEPYTPSQQGIILKAFECNQRTAVIVCDGLRIEIAEAIVNGITDKNVKITKNMAFSVLPSVTENGMSALFGCQDVTNSVQTRFAALKQSVEDVEMIQLDSLNDSITAKHLVLMYGDIDQIGEKKQLRGLKDIDNYEQEIREKIGMLWRLGYEKVVLTTDHGFVLTGILDESDKEPKPDGDILKIDERFVLTVNPLNNQRLIEREGKYMNSNYQYYAPTDKPFVSKGAYGYSHGGFTPQECIIPVYELSLKGGDIALNIQIVNKQELKEVAGNYFTVKLKADGSETDLFTHERKIKLMLFAGNSIKNSAIYTLKAGEIQSPEFELSDGIDKVVVTDKESGAQIDSCNIRKNTARDIEDLF